jgi:phenylpropionate dioxygenase-like ring-hydroxylating dioxygenase large terminal subunit
MRSRDERPGGESEWNPGWEIGDDFIPSERYTSREFFDLEMEKLWPHVWQVACRIEEISETGSFVEYTIGRQSIAVVRVDSSTIKAYVNSCRHRGTQLVSGCGRFEGRSITCPYHGWTWQLDGSIAHVPSREQFSAETLKEENLRLLECQVAEWAGFVFINMDAAAPPLQDAIGVETRYLDPLAIDRMGVLWHKQVILPINWKGASDAFVESYHVQQTHPEYSAFGTDPDAFVYHQDPGGHSYYSVPIGNVSVGKEGDEREEFFRYVSYNIDEIGAMYTERDRHIASRLRHREIPEGSSVAMEYAVELQAYAAEVGIPLPRPEPEVFEHTGFNFVFPHLMFLPTIGNALCYRGRPNGMDPDSTIWDVWSLTIFPEDTAPPPYETVHVDWRDEKQVGRVLFQDFSNMERVGRGMHNGAFRGLRLNTVQEMGILNVHREIDRYLKS